MNGAMQRLVLVLAVFFNIAHAVQLKQTAHGSHGLLSHRHHRASHRQMKPRLMGMINKFRAEKCAHLFEKHGNSFDSYKACLKFMIKVCMPGSDMLMDGDNHEISSGEGFCTSFFPRRKFNKESGNMEEEEKEAEDTGKKLEEELKKGFESAGGGEAGKKLAEGGLDLGGSGDKEDEDDGLKGLDTDGDGIPDVTDLDDDGDGMPDEEDAFPLDPTETVDTDGDGIGDNKDKDDDGDGFLDEEDLYPLDRTEHRDADSDGIPDNQDPDDDNDGTPDAEDDFPLDPSKQQMVVKGSRFHMSEEVGLPAQGFVGHPVEHNNGETWTDDWQLEYGPKGRGSEDFGDDR